jgi:hypothetical protein
VDPWTSYGIVIQNAGVYWYDFQNQTPNIMTYSWTSKIYQQGSKKSFEAFKVFFTVPSNAPTLATCREEAPATDPVWNTLGPNQWITVQIWADVDDGNGDGSLMLVTAREVRRSGELLRIQDGYKAENWQVVIQGRVNVSNMQMATSAKELATV